MTTTPTRLEPHQRGHASDATGADGADCTAEEVKGQRDNIVDRIAAHLNTTTLTQVPYPRKLGDTCQAVALSRACGVEVVHRCGVHDHLFVAPEHDQGVRLVLRDDRPRAYVAVHAAGDGDIDLWELLRHWDEAGR
ncbi:hypothetical protein [Amycolatopsis sp. CA-230715]|uniref:hypothetical protein n=1 Tax=Amycolatopsis sp. CA-230715 TaxID=2745196 RepID=UPI001C00A9D6|nr:hypothetical protein [Amycolatopsis sp. CA-230715]QWF85881.1 hypothetical protein HUW46_09361 [Amycolatopsis sp. CA-230715]